MDNKPPERNRVPHILLVTEDVELRWSIGRVLTHSGYDVTYCRSFSSFVDQIVFKECFAEVAPFDLLIVDERLLDESAIKVLQRMHKQRRRPPLVLLHHSDQQVATSVSVRLQASAVCARFDLADQLATVRQIAPVNGFRRDSLRRPP